MKFVSFKNKANQERFGLLYNDTIVDLTLHTGHLDNNFPSNILEFLNGGIDNLGIVNRLVREWDKKGGVEFEKKDDITLLSPIPHPPSCRDAYAFRQHVESVRKNRGNEMIAEFDRFPVFYFTNHNAITGEGDIVVEKDHLRNLDFELEGAVVIGKRGKNIDVSNADEHIAGYMIMNDFSARGMQMDEMKLNLGPAKGKDFATACGPWLVTTDELNEYKIESNTGTRYDLKMTACFNGDIVSEGNLKDMEFSFAEIIERCSYGAELFPGDIIGSGTVGTGCFLELNGTKKLKAAELNEDFEPVWLKPGDEVELAITGLGTLKNRIVLSDNNVELKYR